MFTHIARVLCTVHVHLASKLKNKNQTFSGFMHVCNSSKTNQSNQWNGTKNRIELTHCLMWNNTIHLNSPLKVNNSSKLAHSITFQWISTLLSRFNLKLIWAPMKGEYCWVEQFESSAFGEMTGGTVRGAKAGTALLHIFILLQHANQVMLVQCAQVFSSWF